MCLRLRPHRALIWYDISVDPYSIYACAQLSESHFLAWESEFESCSYIVFQLVIKQFVNVEFYIRESLIAAGATNAIVSIASLVLPRIITALAAHAGVPALSTDDIGSSDIIKVNNQVTLHRNNAHCTSGDFSIEEHALLELLSTSHQVTHALLHRTSSPHLW
ncbi:hypothetical protein L3X38_011998 [Prunus dulcis]|uniref:Uncharacterized protein n=1 Tax=Prunus dulcis TaxID=3755 RepID=A0AAD4ZFY7_PRUDU|nr:hypothetical protein L3X38_011998 [Prunus dulcis]